MEISYFDSLLPVATSFASQLSAFFNIFIVVIFGSLTLATAFPLGKIYVEFFNKKIDTSLLMTFVLFTFYTISFITFWQTELRLNSVLLELHEQVSDWKIKESTLAVFKPHEFVVLKLSLISIGYIIGSAGSLVLFYLLSNSKKRS